MYAGQRVEIGRAGDVLHSPCHPYTQSLIAAIPTLKGDMPRGLAGAPPLDGPADTGCEFSERCPVCGQDCARISYALTDVGDGHLTACGCGGEL